MSQFIYYKKKEDRGAKDFTHWNKKRGEPQIGTDWNKLQIRL
jgi:hypothetical protein